MYCWYGLITGINVIVSSASSHFTHLYFTTSHILSCIIKSPLALQCCCGVMGGGSSAFLAEDPMGKDRPQYDFMGLSRMDIAAINYTFKAFEKDHSGKRVLVPSILEHYKIKRNKFMERVFTLLHVGEEEEVPALTFKQFVYLLWNFCTLGDKMALFAFSVYDDDRSDTMDTEETNTMLKDIYGVYYASSGHGKELNKKIQRLGRNGLARQQFEEFAKDNEELLEVPNKYLKHICQRTLGIERWAKLTEKRQKMNNNEFMDIYDFLTILNAKTGSNIKFVTLAEHSAHLRAIEYSRKVEEERRKKEARKLKKLSQKESQ